MTVQAAQGRRVTKPWGHGIVWAEAIRNLRTMNRSMARSGTTRAR